MIIRPYGVIYHHGIVRPAVGANNYSPSRWRGLVARAHEFVSSSVETWRATSHEMPIPTIYRRARKHAVPFLPPARTPSSPVMAPKKDEDHPSPQVFPLYLPRKHTLFSLFSVLRIFFSKIACHAMKNL
jgi:hypothetical protein